MGKRMDIERKIHEVCDLGGVIGPYSGFEPRKKALELVLGTLCLREGASERKHRKADTEKTSWLVQGYLTGANRLLKNAFGVFQAVPVTRKKHSRVRRKTAQSAVFQRPASLVGQRVSLSTHCEVRRRADHRCSRCHSPDRP